MGFAMGVFSSFGCGLLRVVLLLEILVLMLIANIQSVAILSWDNILDLTN